MSLKIAAPKPFWDDPSGPVQEFKTWATLFDGWISLQDLDRQTPLTDFQKNNLLLLSLGSEGIKIFHSNPAMSTIQASTYADFSAAVKEAFVIPVNPVRAHYDLFYRRQQSSESVSEFLSSLRTLIAECQFCAECNKLMLATMLVVGCGNATTQEKLLTERSIDFEKFVGILKAEESAREASSHLQSSSQVHKLSKYPSQPKAKKQNESSTTREQEPRKVMHKACGQAHEFGKCKARCSKCGKKGHLANNCKSKASHDDKGQGQSSHKISSVNLAVGSVLSNKAYMCEVSLKIGQRAMSYVAEVDSGADITTITKSKIESAFKDIVFEPIPPPVRVTNFDKSPIPILGTINATITFDDRSAELKVYVVPDNSSAVLGKDAMHALHLQLDPTSFTVATVKNSSLPPAFAKYPSLTTKGIGTFPGYKHVISLKSDATPKVAKLRPVPLSLSDAVSREIRTLIDCDIWEPCPKGEWVHALVVVPKPNMTEVRITTDLSPLNKFIIASHHPMPTAQDLFLKMRGCTIFSRLDLTKAYFHIELDESSRPLTATITQDGIFQYKRTPMGMIDSGNIFQQQVESTIGNEDKTAVSVNDILVGGVNQADLDQRLDVVLKRLAEKDFRINPAKCEFNKKEVTYLGHLISAEGIRPNPRRVTAITDAPPPKNLKELQSFLGFCNYYCGYVPHLATLADPLRKLTRKDTAYEWSDACQESFESIKRAIASDTLTATFDPTAETMLSTDASGVGLGAVLSQVQHGKEVPIAFASRTLKPAERNYATNEAEALACVWGVEHFEKFLVGRHFELRTDHAALEALLQRYGTTRQSKKFYRWYERLSLHNYTVKYRRGSENTPADMLSRLPIATNEEIAEASSVQAITLVPGLSFHVLAQETPKDPVLSKVLEIVKDAQLQVDPQQKTELRPYLHLRYEMYEHNNVVFRRDGRIVVPATLRKRIMEAAHEGHPGIARTKRLLRQSYWWSGFHKEVETFVATCHFCQQSEKSTAPETCGKTQSPLPKVERPWERLSIDIAGPYAVAPASQRFIIAMIDHHSGFPEYKLTGNTSSTSIIRFIEEIFSRYLT